VLTKVLSGIAAAIYINEHYLRTMDITTLGELVQVELQADGIWNDSYAGDRQQWFLDTLDLIRDRFHTLKDFTTLGRAYFADDYAVQEKPLKKNVLKHEGLKEWFPELANRYEKLSDFNLEETERVVRELAEELDIQPGILINGMRTVATGQLAGPSMFDIVVTIGQKKIVERLRNINSLFA
jgi:glutamyl-tRNA synthetase